MNLLEADMNIFVLSHDPEEAASFLCDRHLVKIPDTIVKILCTITEEGPFRIEEEHPWLVWAKAHKDNFTWLIRHGLYVCIEHQRVFGQRHPRRSMIEQHMIYLKRYDLPEGFSVFPIYMPEEFKVKKDGEYVVVGSYRKYYMSKADINIWKNRIKPHWWKP